MDSIDTLALTCKILFNERIIEQRQEIEKLKKELEEEVFVVITEEHYGGGEDIIKVFRKEEDAIKYIQEIENTHGLDTNYYKLRINN